MTPSRSRPKPVQARVLLRRPAEGDDFGTQTAADNDRRDAAWAQNVLLGRRLGPRTTHPIVRLTDDGIDWGTMPRPGDEVGFAMDPHRPDTCLRAAIATCTQIAIEEVPDPQLDRRLRDGDDPDHINRSSWERIETWAAKRGLAMRCWAPVPLRHHRWIGVVPSPNQHPGRFSDHCLVMSHNRLVFNPACSVKAPPGTRTYCNPAEISYGITLEKEH